MRPVIRPFSTGLGCSYSSQPSQGRGTVARQRNGGGFYIEADTTSWVILFSGLTFIAGRSRRSTPTVWVYTEGATPHRTNNPSIRRGLPCIIGKGLAFPSCLSALFKGGGPAVWLVVGSCRRQAPAPEHRWCARNGCNFDRKSILFKRTCPQNGAGPIHRLVARGSRPLALVCTFSARQCYQTPVPGTGNSFTKLREFCT